MSLLFQGLYETLVQDISLEQSGMSDNESLFAASCQCYIEFAVYLKITFQVGGRGKELQLMGTRYGQRTDDKITLATLKTFYRIYGDEMGIRIMPQFKFTAYHGYLVAVRHNDSYFFFGHGSFFHFQEQRVGFDQSSCEFSFAGIGFFLYCLCVRGRAVYEQHSVVGEKRAERWQILSL